MGSEGRLGFGQAEKGERACHWGLERKIKVWSGCHAWSSQGV